MEHLCSDNCGRSAEGYCPICSFNFCSECYKSHYNQEQLKSQAFELATQVYTNLEILAEKLQEEGFFLNSLINDLLKLSIENLTQRSQKITDLLKKTTDSEIIQEISNLNISSVVPLKDQLYEGLFKNQLDSLKQDLEIVKQEALKGNLLLLKLSEKFEENSPQSKSKQIPSF
jgi:hypothetical protein